MSQQMSFSKAMTLATLMLGMNIAAAELNCSLSSVRCVGPGEEYDTNVSLTEVPFQQAADDSAPGDTILIRGGTYYHDESKSPTRRFLDIKNSGQSGKPITIRPYDGEKVVLHGFGFPEGTSGPTTTNEYLIVTSGNYITVKGLDLQYATRAGMIIDGSYGVIENMTVHDNWLDGIVIGSSDKTIQGNVIKNSEAYRNRHGTGFMIRRSGTSHPVIDTQIRNCISYNNGYQPDGAKVPAVNGDSDGGGNSDGFGASKFCHDDASGTSYANLCPSNQFYGNIAWHNADDGFDTTIGEGSSLVNNISFSNGPEGQMGYKILRYVSGQFSYIGNIALGNDSRGFEPRVEDTVRFVNNLSVGNTNQGVMIGVQSSNVSNIKVADNISTNNGGSNAINYAADANLTSDSISLYTPITVRTNFPSALTISEKAEFIRNQFISAYMPADETSPVVDAGVVIEGVHCTRADDDAKNPMPPDQSCRHWMGAAPDIGPFEYGLRTSPNPPSPPMLISGG